MRRIGSYNSTMDYFENRRERAEKRVKELKGFYRHMRVFIIINGLLYLLKSGVLHSVLPNGFPTEAYYFSWVDVNIVVWLLILGVHTLYIFRAKLPFLKKWEDRQIQKYLDKENNGTKKYR